MMPSTNPWTFASPFGHMLCIMSFVSMMVSLAFPVGVVRQERLIIHKLHPAHRCRRSYDAAGAPATLVSRNSVGATALNPGAAIGVTSVAVSCARGVGDLGRVGH